MLRRTRRRARAAAHLYARIGPVKADAESFGVIPSGCFLFLVEPNESREARKADSEPGERKRTLQDSVQQMCRRQARKDQIMEGNLPSSPFPFDRTARRRRGAEKKVAGS